jgi:hypothetical protein
VRPQGFGCDSTWQFFEGTNCFVRGGWRYEKTGFSLAFFDSFLLLLALGVSLGLRARGVGLKGWRGGSRSCAIGCLSGGSCVSMGGELHPYMSLQCLLFGAGTR